MSVFSPLLICVVYVCIASSCTSISWARHLGSMGVGVTNREDPQHATFQNPSKSPEKTKVLDMSTVTLGTNASTTTKQEDQGRMRSKMEEERPNVENPRSLLDDRNQNQNQAHQGLRTNDAIIRAQNHHENDAKLPPPSPNPKGKGSRRVAKRKRTMPRAMVSWRVPRKKKQKKGAHQEQEEQPDFDLDYAPPKVHPPTHN